MFFNTRLVRIFFFFFLLKLKHSQNHNSGAKNLLLALQKVTLSILPPHFIIHSTSNILFFYHFIWNNIIIKKLINIIKEERENLSFLIEGKEKILIKYFILFLTTWYSQLVFISIYCNCKKISFNFSNNTWFFSGKIAFFAKMQSPLWMLLLFLDWIVVNWARLII